MNKPTIESLTWATTLMGAVVSACWLAAGDAALPDPRLLCAAGRDGPRPPSALRSPAGSAADSAAAGRRRQPEAARRPLPAWPHAPHGTPGIEKV